MFDFHVVGGLEVATAPQEHVGGRRVYWPRGKLLSSSSSMNAMVYIRGHRANYDEKRATSGIGWSYADVLPYFKRSEDKVRGASGETLLLDALRRIIDAAGIVGCTGIIVDAKDGVAERSSTARFARTPAATSARCSRIDLDLDPVWRCSSGPAVR